MEDRKITELLLQFVHVTYIDGAYEIYHRHQNEALVFQTFKKILINTLLLKQFLVETIEEIHQIAFRIDYSISFII